MIDRAGVELKLRQIPVKFLEMLILTSVSI
jgi:hypothetical protein